MLTNLFDSAYEAVTVPATVNVEKVTLCPRCWREHVEIEPSPGQLVSLSESEM